MLKPDLIARALKGERPSHEEFINIVYRGLLGRNADRAGIETYTRVIQENGTADALVRIIAAIASSDEAARYRSR